MAQDAKKARRLGKGLSQLVGEAPVRIPAPETSIPDPAPDAAGALRTLPVADIIPNKAQPRRTFDEQGLRELADSIRMQGLMQPIVVRSRSGGGYELIAGERRLRAARLAGLETIPAIVREVDDRTSAELALIENVQREDLNPMERGWAYRQLAERFQLTHAQVAERVGVERSSVTNMVRLTELEQDIQDLISKGLLSTGQAKVVLRVPPGSQRQKLAIEGARGASVRALETMVEAMLHPKESAARATRPNSPDIEALEKQLGEHLGTKVQIKPDKSGTRGRITVQFFDLDHFDDLMQRVGIARHSAV